MPTAALAVVMTFLGCVLNLNWTLVDSGTTAVGQTSGSSAPHDTAKTCEDPGGNGGIDTMTGTISSDSAVFTSDKDQKAWHITNTDSVKGHEGQRVKLEAWVYADKSEMCVQNLKVTGEKKAPGKSQKK